LVLGIPLLIGFVNKRLLDNKLNGLRITLNIVIALIVITHLVTMGSVAALANKMVSLNALVWLSLSVVAFYLLMLFDMWTTK